jgi:cyclophilin family peptidyl-prolyl cis-trans isomerase
VGMALAGRDTGGSQFFITHNAQPHLDGRYTAFGRVVRGMEAVDTILQDDVILEARVVR